MKATMLSAAILLLLTLTGTNAQNFDCGQAPLNNKAFGLVFKFDSKLVGGQDALEGAWPWQASLQFKGSHFCGGTLINNQWILTGTHCFPQAVLNSQQDFTVILGRHALDTVSPNEVIRGSSQIIRHGSFSNSTFDNDVALVQLNQSVTFTNYIRPVCLAAAGSVYGAGTPIWLSGWGTLSTSTLLPYPRRLHEVQLTITDHDICVNAYSSLSPITSNMICAGLDEPGKDACEGDSGGPMVNKVGSRWVQGGSTSFGRGCDEAGFPRVFTEVSKYQTWIEQQLGTNMVGFVDSQNPAVTTTTSTTTTTTASVCQGSGVLHLASLSLSVLPVLLTLCVL